MAEIRVNRTQWQWMTQQPYTDGVFSCPDNIAAQLVNRGAAEYAAAVNDDKFDTMKRRELMKHAKLIGIKTSPRWKKSEVLQVIREFKQ